MHIALTAISLNLALLSITCFGQNRTKIERSTYERLLNVKILKIKIPVLKDRRAQELQALANLIILKAVDRIMQVYGPSKEPAIATIKKYVSAIPEPTGPNDYVRTAYSYAISEFNEQIKRDNERLKGIGAITGLPEKQKNDLIQIELEELNERYSPIIDALKQLKPETRLPQALSLDALEHFTI